MTLQLIRLPLRLPLLHRWAAERGMVDRHGIDEGQALHHLLAETFGKAALQPFRIFPLPGGKATNVYAYAAAPSELLVHTAQTIALPEHLMVIDRRGWRASKCLSLSRANAWASRCDCARWCGSCAQSPSSTRSLRR